MTNAGNRTEYNCMYVCVCFMYFKYFTPYMLIYVMAKMPTSQWFYCVFSTLICRCRCCCCGNQHLLLFKCDLKFIRCLVLFSCLDEIKQIYVCTHTEVLMHVSVAGVVIAISNVSIKFTEFYTLLLNCLHIVETNFLLFAAFFVYFRNCPKSTLSCGAS